MIPNRMGKNKKEIKCRDPLYLAYHKKKSTLSQCQIGKEFLRCYLIVKSVHFLAYGYHLGASVVCKKIW